MNSQDKKIPVTVLTGHLGAGKTTLLNHILSGDHGKKYAVIVNEFGEIGIDNALVVGSDEEIYEMNNGCICCTVRGDLIRVLRGLLRRSGQFDGILIETTGLADPAPVVQTFFADADVAAKTRIDGVITVVDAKHLPLRLAESESREAEEQVAFADVIILNKCDLVSVDDLAVLEARLLAINPYAKIQRAERSVIDVAAVLDMGAFDLDRVLANDPSFLDGEKPHEAGCGCSSCGHHHHHHEHAHEHTPKVGHDPLISSVSMAVEGDLDPDKFDAWIGKLSGTRGIDLLRYKGILSFEGSPKRFVFQGVHQMMEGKPLDDWEEGAVRRSRFVLIGRHLDKDALQRDFAACQSGGA